MKTVTVKDLMANQQIKVTLLVGILFKLVMCDEEIPASVIRRLGGDSYTHFNSSVKSICHDDGNLTYMIGERRCVKNQELYHGTSP